MPASFISEPLKPLAGSFDPSRMGLGEPGVPERFRWKNRDLIVAEILESWKEHGDCKHGSGERYLRRHVFRIRMDDGSIARIYFQRSFGRASGKVASRWWLHSLEDTPSA